MSETLCLDCGRPMFVPPTLPDEGNRFRCRSYDLGWTTSDCHDATVDRAVRAEQALEIREGMWLLRNDRVHELEAERDALQARIDAAVAECAKHAHRSDGVGLWLGIVAGILTGDKEPHE